jgi:hypothetical protein
MIDSSVILEPFENIDKLLFAHSTALYSLNPKEQYASSFSSIGRDLLEMTDHGEIVKTVGVHLTRIIEAQFIHFPENIFWDFNTLAGYMVQQAEDVYQETAGSEYDDTFRFINLYTSMVIKLWAKFGKHSTIRFRYVHDFIYGFDWAKWVAQSPKERSNIHPLSMRYMKRMMERGEELQHLIARNDEEYHQLSGDEYRNPFAFHRHADEEMTTLKMLAQQDYIPLKSWLYNTTPAWNKEYATIRTQTALDLGFGK